MRTSAVLIVRNEAHCLARCLASLQGVVDEILVTDTGSTDDTPQLARDHGARVTTFAWCNDFSAARNFAIAEATGEVVLTIDADEFLVTPADAARECLARFSEAPVLALGLVELINLRDDIPDSTDHPARVFRREAFRYAGAIHEQLVGVSSESPHAFETGLRLHHTGYHLPPEQAAAKAHRNIALLRRELEQNPDDEYFRYQLGKAWASLGRHKAAALAFEQALRAIDFGQSPPQGRLGAVGRSVLTGAVCGAGYALINSGEPGRAVRLLEEHERLAHPGTQCADFFHALGYAWLQAGALDKADAAYRLALGLPEDVQGTGSWSCWYHLGLIDEARGDTIGAVAKYREALRLRPGYPPALARNAELDQ